MYRKLLPWYIEKEKEISIKEVQKKRFIGQSLTLLNWNVYKNNHNFKWLRDFEQILNSYSPDIITFQEYRTKSRRSVLDANKNYGYAFSANIELYGHSFGLLSASICNTKSCNSTLSYHVEPLIKTPKINLSTEYRLQNNQTITVINTHLINFVKNRKYLSQIRQIERLCQGDNRVILAGDFNTWSSKRMHILKSMAENLNLNYLDFKVNYHKKGYLSYPLDHIFYRGVVPVKSKILSDIKSSDHKPMIVEFKTF